MTLRKRTKAIKKRIVLLLHKYFGNYDYKKFVVITTARTGSNWLISLMSSHKNISAYGEVFNILRGRSTDDIWKEVFNKKLRKVKFIGFKIFYDHPLNTNDKSVWNKILSDKSIHIIHLKRENMLRSFISLKIAHKTQTWGLTPENTNNTIEEKIFNHFN